MAILIFVLSSRPAPSLGATTPDTAASYLAHFLLYAVLSFCLLKALAVSSYRGAALVALAVLLYGVSDELHQATVDTRDSSLADVGVDFVGALAGVFVSRMLRF